MTRGEDDLKRIVARAKAQEAKLRTSLDESPDGSAGAAQKKLMARAEWEPFKAEFSRMVAGLNGAIEEGGLELRVSIANDPMGCGRIAVALLRRLGGLSGEQIIFTVEPSGTVSVSYKELRKPTDVLHHLDTVTSPMADFRDSLIQFLLAATES